MNQQQKDNGKFFTPCAKSSRSSTSPLSQGSQSVPSSPTSQMSSHKESNQPTPSRSVGNYQLPVSGSTPTSSFRLEASQLPFTEYFPPYTEKKNFQDSQAVGTSQMHQSALSTSSASHEGGSYQQISSPGGHLYPITASPPETNLYPTAPSVEAKGCQSNPSGSVTNSHPHSSASSNVNAYTLSNASPDRCIDQTTAPSPNNNLYQVTSVSQVSHPMPSVIVNCSSGSSPSIPLSSSPSTSTGPSAGAEPTKPWSQNA